MREILFRGKRIDNGELVEGVFLNDRDGASYICPSVSDISYGDSGNRRRIGCWYKVDPSTVGQYTGMNDKHGKRIFENDILSIWNETHDVVVFEDGAFDLENTSIPIRFANKFEVIGNIHDNPEYMKGDAD